MLASLLRAMRPRQWTKNGIIYFAFIFTINQRWELGQWAEGLELFGTATAAFLLFCVLSSATYLINDLLDASQDRLHPQKRRRPIAAGEVGPRTALAVALGMFAAGIGLSFLLEPWFGAVAFGYLLLTGAYSLGLRRLALLDVLALSGGYLLRAVAGAVVIQVPVSPWLYIVTGLGALLIGFGKRRNELVLAEDQEEAARQRQALQGYSVRLLDQLISVVAPATLIAYILYTFTAENLPADHTMMLTIPLVTYALFRYLYLVYQRNLGESPEELLLKDLPLIAAGLLWLLTVVGVLAVARGS